MNMPKVEEEEGGREKKQSVSRTLMLFIYLPTSVPNPFNYVLIGIGILGDVLWSAQLQAGACVSLSAGGEH